MTRISNRPASARELTTAPTDERAVQATAGAVLVADLEPRRPAMLAEARCGHVDRGAEGQVIGVRRGRAGDLEAVLRMHLRCSAATLQRRYESSTPSRLPWVRVRRVLDPARAICVVASRGEEVVGMAELTWSEPTGAQAGLLVEDAWQRRGIGSRLLRALAVAAAQRGFDRISCDTARQDRAALAMIHRAGFQTSTRIRDGRAQTSFWIPRAARPPSARTATVGDGSRLGRPDNRRTPTPSASG